MKKILFAIAFVVIMSLGGIAQTDGFFRVNNVEDCDYRNEPNSGFDFSLPQSHGYEYDTNAPLGGGLLILTALGVGYALKKKRS